MTSRSRSRRKSAKNLGPKQRPNRMSGVGANPRQSAPISSDLDGSDQTSAPGFHTGAGSWGVDGGGSTDSSDPSELGKDKDGPDSWPSVLHRIMMGGYRPPSRRVIAFGVLLCIGWMFIVDNNNGKLNSWDDILWTCQKCLIPTAVGILAIIGVSIFRRAKG